MSALKVAENSTAVIYVPRGMGLVVNGGNASGATGAGAGIEVPSSSTLVITGGGTIIATGGNAADVGYVDFDVASHTSLSNALAVAAGRESAAATIRPAGTSSSPRPGA